MKKQGSRRRKTPRKSMDEKICTSDLNKPPKPVLASIKHNAPVPAIAITLPSTSPLVFNTFDNQVQNHDRLTTCQQTVQSKGSSSAVHLATNADTSNLVCSYNVSDLLEKSSPLYPITSISSNKSEPLKVNQDVDDNQFYITQLDNRVVLIPFRNPVKDDIQERNKPEEETSAHLINLRGSESFIPSSLSSTNSACHGHNISSVGGIEVVASSSGSRQLCHENIFANSKITDTTSDIPTAFELTQFPSGKIIQNHYLTDPTTEKEKEDDNNNQSRLEMIADNQGYQMSLADDRGPCDVTISKLSRQQLSLMTQLTTDDDSDTETYIINTKEDVEDLLDKVAGSITAEEENDDGGVDKAVKPDEVTQVRYPGQLSEGNSLVQPELTDDTDPRFIGNNFTIHMISDHSNNHCDRSDNWNEKQQVIKESNYIMQFDDNICDFLQVPNAESERETNIESKHSQANATESNNLSFESKTLETCDIPVNGARDLDQIPSSGETSLVQDVFSDDDLAQQNSQDSEEVLVFLIADDQSHGKW